MRKTHPLIMVACVAIAAFSSGDIAFSRPYDVPNLAEPTTTPESPEEISRLRIMSRTVWTYQADPSGALGDGYKSSYAGYGRDGNVVEQMSYDPNGTVLVRIVNTYDGAGFLIESVGEEHNGVAARTVFGYDGERIASTTSYDPDGNLIVTSLYEYDSSDRTTIALTEAPSVGVSQRTVFEYDDDQDAARAATYDSQGRVLAQSETLRDGEGRPIESSAFLPDGSIGSIISYAYDAGGRPLEVVVEDANGAVLQRTTRVYDADGRVIEISQSSPAADLEHRVTLHYGEDGTLTAERTYNKLGELVTEIRHVYEYYEDGPDNGGN